MEERLFKVVPAVMMATMSKMGRFASGRGFFVTGTDTGVGKTVVAGAIARYLRTRAQKVGVCKPIATGCAVRREGLVSPDAEFLAHCSDTDLSLDQINPIRYREPLAPWIAAERARRPVDWHALEQACRLNLQQHDCLVVEGIGGVMVPIEKRYLVLDLMVDFALPVVIVARSGLGTVNHTLLTLEACRRRQLRILGVVINGYDPEGADPAQQDNPRLIEQVGGVRVLCIIPRDIRTCVNKGLIGPDVQAAIALADWIELLG
ncbi:MAG: dethiobiotin synthase [Sedimentisphaerales bacterium]|nr:dethiobiotin synthase [Sedimentisphaerales bacterium]